MAYRHTPAMLKEVISYLSCRPGKTYVDGTLGGSGHAGAICDKIAPGGVFIGIDQDIDAINHAKAVLQNDDLQIHILHGNFIRLPEFLSQLRINKVDGILLDLGLSQNQLERSGRGFSFRKDEPLDMRMDIRSPQTAEHLVNKLAQEELQQIFQDYGEERWAKRIAGNLVRIRQKKKFAPANSSHKLYPIRSRGGRLLNKGSILPPGCLWDCVSRSTRNSRR